MNNLPYVIEGVTFTDDVAFAVDMSAAPGGWVRWRPFVNCVVGDLPKDMLADLGFDVSLPKIYIAGPMTGVDNFNYAAFDMAADALSCMYDVVNPVDLDREEGIVYDGVVDMDSYLASLDMKAIIKRDLEALATCQYIFMLDGWQGSKGARAEKAFAEWSGIHVVYQTDPQAQVSTAQQRKDTPVYSGVLNYFPQALRDVARCSKAGNDQHNPGQPMFWDRTKSSDELDALTRHLLEAGTIDTDGIRHSTKVAWRALANLEKEIENE